MPRRKVEGDKATIAQGPWRDLALHTLGWKAFQDLAAHVCEEVLRRPVEVYREAQDGGQDAAFYSKMKVGSEKTLGGTIQCKFSSDPSRTFRLADISDETSSINTLNAEGHADFYVVVTNMSVDGTVAAKFKAKMKTLGVRYPHIFGKQFLIWAIRRSARLRALVPRVYGLGDLSTILDERRAKQTQALLGHMMSTLNVYVPTTAHVSAVKMLAEHGIVLILGDAATGKSAIAAILAALAADHSKHECFKADGPSLLLDNWNPDEKGAFYWIDDAFGPNQLREDFVDTWISIMPKVQAAIARGHHFVLTSRRHIYEAAKPKLGTRNHPLFRHGQAIVDVGKTTRSQREQILYNHVKSGNQPAQWKVRVKPLLAELSKLNEFLPELARRLGDPLFTKGLVLSQESLVTFFREPKEHLIQVLRELSRPHQAALVLVFLHRSRMPVGVRDVAMERHVMKHFGVDRATLAGALDQLRASFLVEKSEGGAKIITFAHPTITDAISAILETAEFVELYLLGTKIEILIENAVCEGAVPIEDAVVIPDRYRSLVVKRLGELPNEKGSNGRLFSFLATRASPAVFRDAMAAYPKLLRRETTWWWKEAANPRVQASARALELGVLPDDVRENLSQRLESALVNDLDTSFVDDDRLLALIRPTRLLKVFISLRSVLAETVASRADSIADDADLDLEPEENFDELFQLLEALESLFDNDDSISEPVSEAREAIDEAVGKVRERKRSKDEVEDDWDWDRMILSKEESKKVDGPAPIFAPRSVFSDVDK